MTESGSSRPDPSLAGAELASSTRAVHAAAEALLPRRTIKCAGIRGGTLHHTVRWCRVADASVLGAIVLRMPDDVRMTVFADRGAASALSWVTGRGGL
jgi:hypothetical protein